MTAAGNEYEDADVNSVDNEYEAGDVNMVAEADDDDDFEEDEYEEGDINAVASESHSAGHSAGNQSSGGMPLAVLTYIAQSLSNEPEGVVVNTEQRQGGVRLSLHVAPTDMGRVIGRRGRTAQAIRVLVGAAGAREGVQTSVDIVDD